MNDLCFGESALRTSSINKPDFNMYLTQSPNTHIDLQFTRKADEKFQLKTIFNWNWDRSQGSAMSQHRMTDGCT